MGELDEWLGALVGTPGPEVTAPGEEPTGASEPGLVHLTDELDDDLASKR